MSNTEIEMGSMAHQDAESSQASKNIIIVTSLGKTSFEIIANLIVPLADEITDILAGIEFFRLVYPIKINVCLCVCPSRFSTFAPINWSEQNNVHETVWL